MKYSAILSMLILFACGCNSTDARTKLATEQQILKDSANNINERIGGYLQKDATDSAEAKGKQLAAVHTRLIEIQSSLDSLDKMKQ
jgi:glycerate-2-kinase